ncbi:Cytidine/deoxycytidylate deaminase family protein [Hibiscus syriacus]|uniref:Cytidine/deoxycytidylate deaminase family protein n=1 Tax=Hibiscus syriacus TaxID=106335 RepID=A0A6A2WGX2_HIBSY|nr:Cytidine/deoxycytidylate deaminase family protein [Hibiscus syriacus]
MTMKPNPQCSNTACLERQKEYILAKPARDAATKAKMEAEASAVAAAGDVPLHVDNERNISVVDDNEQEECISFLCSVLNILQVLYTKFLELIRPVAWAQFPYQIKNSRLSCSSPHDALPEGLTHELPSADGFQKLQPSEATDTTIDDLEDLQRQLDALNAD